MLPVDFIKYVGYAYAEKMFINSFKCLPEETAKEHRKYT
jgi:hypothetical protein